MRQMKLLGVDYGSLKTVKMSGIQNVEAICQLAAIVRTGTPVNEAVVRTHSVQYGEQSSSQVTGSLMRGSTAGRPKGSSGC